MIERLLRYLLFFPIGLMGLWAFMGHVFVPEEAARGIGWMPSPFQREVGMANLGIGIAGIVAVFRGRDFRLATAIVTACFLIGAGLGHIYEIVKTGNLAPGNAGQSSLRIFSLPWRFSCCLSWRGPMLRRSPPPKAGGRAWGVARAAVARAVWRHGLAALCEGKWNASYDAGQRSSG